MEIKVLTDDFYNKYSKESYPQILIKRRGYGIIQFNINNIIFGIPLKSNIKTNNDYFSLKTVSDATRRVNPGLYYRKAIIITNDNYLGENFIISNNTYNYIQMNEMKIKTDFKRYLSKYQKYIEKPIQRYYMAYNYMFSSLHYFLEYFGINPNECELRYKKIILAEHICILKNYIKKDTGQNIFIRENGNYTNPSTCISLNSIIIIKNFTYLNMEDYVCMKENQVGEISSSRGIKYSEILENIKNCIESNNS